MSSCKDQDPTLTPEWFEALISSPAPPAVESTAPHPSPEDMLARKCSRCGAYKKTPESTCTECEE